MAGFMEELERVRHVVNHPPIQARLMRDRTRWFELCVSMDVIEDAFLACGAYKSLGAAEDKGAIYLVI